MSYEILITNNFNNIYMFRVYNFRIFDKKTFRYFYYTELPKVLEPHVIGMHKYDVKRLLPPVRVRIK